MITIEEFLVNSVQGNSIVANLTSPIGGGFLAQLPKGLLNPDGSLVDGPPTWTFLRVGGNVDHTLQGARGPRMCRLQIDCYGKNAADAVTLALAIDTFLDGFSGVAFDNEVPANFAGIMSCLAEQEPVDGFDASGRNWRRTLEYQLVFAEGRSA